MNKALSPPLHLTRHRKPGADLLTLAYHITCDLLIIITRSTNNYGPFQDREKLISIMITRALHNEPFPIYGNGSNIRDWTYVEGNCRAIDLVRLKGAVGEINNVATVAAIELSGATSVLIDISSDTYTLDPDQVEEVITHKQRLFSRFTCMVTRQIWIRLYPLLR